MPGDTSSKKSDFFHSRLGWLVALQLGVGLFEHFSHPCWNVNRFDLVQVLCRQPQPLKAHRWTSLSRPGDTTLQQFLPTVQNRCFFFISISAFVISFFCGNQPNRVHVALTFLSLMVSDVEHLFICHARWMVMCISLDKCPFGCFFSHLNYFIPTLAFLFSPISAFLFDIQLLKFFIYFIMPCNIAHNDFILFHSCLFIAVRVSLV